jgi:IS5 family transposase
MKQQSLAIQGVFEKYGRKSRRELFLDEMEKVVPWSALESLVRPHYAKAGKGRQPVGLSIMLRTYFVQQWFNLSDPGVEEALYESAALRRFVGVDLGIAPAPDETTVLRFRHLLERHDLGGLMLDAVNVHLEARGSRSRRARSWMRPSSMRLRRRRTQAASAIPRCTRPGKETNGSSG